MLAPIAPFDRGGVADTCYRVLLRALPAEVRRDFGDDMVQMFRDHRRSLAGRPFQLTTLWLQAFADVLTHARADRPPGERYRRPSMGILMRRLLTDIRLGLRALRRYPASTCIAVVTLALGIGASTAIYSLVDGVLLRTVPFPEPNRLARVTESRLKEGALENPVSAADFLDWRQRNDAFENLAAFTGVSVTVTGSGEPEEVLAGAVSWAFFDVLGVQPERGRLFRQGDEVFGQHLVVVLTHGFWQRRFGGDPAIVGRQVTINGNPCVVIGVLPTSFHFIDTRQDVWAPLVLEAPGVTPSRVNHNYDVYGRLKPDVTMEQARVSMEALGLAMQTQYPAESNGHGVYVSPMRESFVRPVEKSLIVLLAAVGFVMLIACVNVANLLLARAASRRREMAVQAALGASRAMLICQTLVESLTLAAAGGLAGIGVALLIFKVLPLVMPTQIAFLDLESMTINLRLLGFTCGLSLLTGLIFGLLPALHASRPLLTDALKTGGRSVAGVRRGARIALVVSEVALATLTLVGAGLAVRSFRQVLAQPLGFESANRLTLSVSVPRGAYDTDDKRRAVMTSMEQALATIPGVVGVGAIDILPLGGGNSRTGVVIEGREVQPGDPPTRMHPRTVTPGYFAAMHIALKGRGFLPSDDARSEQVVVVSEASAAQYWPGQNAVGRRMRFTNDRDWRTVVGIAADVRHWGLMRPVNPMLYVPQAQSPSSRLTFVLEADSRIDPSTLGSAVRAAVASVDRNVPPTAIQTMDEVVAASVKAERSQALLMGAFGVVALLLAALGIYGVMAQLVASRVHEIGVRMTLGARPRRVLRLLLVEGLWQTIAGVAIGLVGGVWLMRLSQDVLFQVQPWDPAALSGATATLIVAAVLACWVPARRAMRVNPVEALRAQ